MEDTLADFPPAEYTISAFCDHCDHSSRVPVDRLPPEPTISKLKTSLRCSMCGHRGAEIRIIYTGAGEYHYGDSPPGEETPVGL